MGERKNIDFFEIGKKYAEGVTEEINIVKKQYEERYGKSNAELFLLGVHANIAHHGEYYDADLDSIVESTVCGNPYVGVRSTIDGECELMKHIGKMIEEVSLEQESYQKTKKLP